MVVAGLVVDVEAEMVVVEIEVAVVLALMSVVVSWVVD